MPTYLLPALQEHDESQFLAAFSVPASGEGYFLNRRFEPALLLLFADGAPLHAAREAVLSLRMNWQQVLSTAPMVFTPQTLQRHVDLYPLFGQHVTRHAQCLVGQALSLDNTGSPHPVERLAFLITAAIDASAALVPSRAEAHSLAQLQRLAAQLGSDGSTSEASAADLFAQVQVYLRLFVDSLPMMSKKRTAVVKTSEEPNLLAFYEDQQRLLVLIPPLSASLLRKIDWSALARPMPSHLTTLNVATTDQLYLTIQSERSLDFVLGSYRRQWGADLLSGLEVPARAVYRQAARKPSTYLVDGVLGNYLIAPDDEAIHRVIHDYQNRLLNMRLEHELLCRLLDRPLAEPPAPLPRRDEPLSERIDAVVEHLDWWATHYVRQLAASKPDFRLSPR